MADAERCETCRYHSRLGECRRNAPVVLPFVIPAGTATEGWPWPHTAGDQWCGEWSTKDALCNAVVAIDRPGGKVDFCARPRGHDGGHVAAVEWPRPHREVRAEGDERMCLVLVNIDTDGANYCRLAVGHEGDHVA